MTAGVNGGMDGALAQALIGRVAGIAVRKPLVEMHVLAFEHDVMQNGTAGMGWRRCNRGRRM